jgi:hypothetical protein
MTQNGTGVIGMTVARGSRCRGLNSKLLAATIGEGPGTDGQFVWENPCET